MDVLDRLIGHDIWTTQLVLTRCRELTTEQWHQPFDISHATVHQTLAHMLGNIEVWTDLMGEQPIRRQPVPSAGPDALSEWQARFAAASDGFAKMARARAAEGQLDALWTDILDHPPTRKSYGGAITHVLTHNMVHRTELLHMLQRLGLEDLPEGDVLSWEQQAGSTANK